MEAIKEFYTFQGIPFVFAFIVVVLTLAACAGTIYRHHHQATTAIKEQYEQYKKQASEKSKETKDNLKSKYGKGKPENTTEESSKKAKPKKKEDTLTEKQKLRIRNETVEKATAATIMQMTGYLGIGFLILTLLAAIF